MPKRLISLAALLLFTTGCPPRGDLQPAVDPPENHFVALERVNDNLRRVDQPLSCRAVVSFRFRDDGGKKHSFIGHDARLIYSTPDSLYFDVRAALSGSVARFGSNEERYWLWLDVPDVRKLWWGTWADADADVGRRLPVPPNELLDALMLRPLPLSLSGGPAPLLRIVDDDHRLMFYRPASGGRPRGMREIRLDPRPPHLPLEIIDRLADGREAMHAQLSKYKPVGPDGPMMPRHYVVRWPENDAEMRLDIRDAKFRSDLPADVFEFPVGWQGEIEQIDRPAEDAAQP